MKIFDYKINLRNDQGKVYYKTSWYDKCPVIFPLNVNFNIFKYILTI